MRKRHPVLFAAFAFGLASAAAHAQEFQRPDVPLKGRIGLSYWHPENNVTMDFGSAESSYDNAGQEYRLDGKLEFGDLGVQAYYIEGRMNTLPGGSDYGSPTYNPSSGEKQRTASVSVCYNLFTTPYTGTVDFSLGYYRMWAQPSLTASNWNSGLEFAIDGRREWQSGFAVSYRIGYTPSSTIFSSTDAILRADSLLNYWAQIEYPVYKQFGLTCGYYGSRMKGIVTFGNADASVTAHGVTGGLMYKF